MGAGTATVPSGPGGKSAARPGIGRLVGARPGSGLQVQQREGIHRVDPGAGPALLRASRLEVAGPVPRRRASSSAACSST